jgi:hypothetical protein
MLCHHDSIYLILYEFSANFKKISLLRPAYVRARLSVTLFGKCLLSLFRWSAWTRFCQLELESKESLTALAWSKNPSQNACLFNGEESDFIQWTKEVLFDKSSIILHLSLQYFTFYSSCLNLVIYLQAKQCSLDSSKQHLQALSWGLDFPEWSSIFSFNSLIAVA